jgi:predicted Zn finger-like uncharacterized protein
VYTRCPECLSAHVVNAELLAHSRGSVRCGRCNRKFDALEQLFDEWPTPEATPPPAGARYRPPVLGNKEDLNAPFGPAYIRHRGGSKRQGLWRVLLLVLAVVTVVNVAWVFRDWFGQLTVTRFVMSELGSPASGQNQAINEPEQIHLVSRDLHVHPTRPGVLVLSATFVNGSDHAQNWPSLDLTLLDINGKGIARRSFSVEDYMPGRGVTGDLLGPKVHVPVLLEFANPGDRAVGFDIRFH